ncbi:SsgA family sporulation/cell division regulator [Streptomyces sp. NRRL S-813]|uniref:SsgA family sporulation/cell division regulator n=1 Tax=Streptomyces sp. NRRL S-813 TaxID=1463919 RepID=UPI0004C2555F|nr:SsgA family sporulation/cell division regulator [Streptomyces sp. NRRL S-813]
MPRPSTDAVDAELCALLVMPDGSAVPVSTRLGYRPDDPYAVRATFRLGGDRAVEWFFARELLREGLLQPVGIGDVRLRPARHQGQHMVQIVLTPPAGRVDLMFPWPVVTEFLQRTDAVVPPGTEPVHVDVDAQLMHLLAEH